MNATELTPMMNLKLPVHKSNDPFERAHFIVATFGGRVVCFTDDEGDADDIVLACNSFATLSAHNRELVAALEEALPYVSGWTGAVPLAKSPEQAAKCLTRLSAALALSRGGKT